MGDVVVVVEVVVEDLVLVGAVPVAPEQAAAAAAHVLDVVADDLEAAGLVGCGRPSARRARGRRWRRRGRRATRARGSWRRSRRRPGPSWRGERRSHTPAGRGGSGAEGCSVSATCCGVGSAGRERSSPLCRADSGRAERGAGAAPEGLGHRAGLVGVAVAQAGPADAAGRALGRLEGVPRELGPAGGRGGRGPDGGGEAGGLVARGLVARGLVAGCEGVDRAG